MLLMLCKLKYKSNFELSNGNVDNPKLAVLSKEYRPMTFSIKRFCLDLHLKPKDFDIDNCENVLIFSDFF